jgi:hypothetical protein
MASKKKYLKEAREEIEKCLAETKEGKGSTSESMMDELKNSLKVEEILEDSDKQIQQEKIRLKTLSSAELMQWLMDKHDAFTELFDYMISPGFLDGEDYFSRYCIITYMQQLNVLLSVYEIEFTEEMVAVLRSKNYAELLSMLNVLNFI